MVKIDSKKLVQLFLSIVITSIFIYLFNLYIGFGKLILLFESMTIMQFFAGFFLYILSYIFRTVRWGFTLYLKDFKKLFKITVFNTFFNIVLPFRIGELSFFYMLRKEGVDLSHSTLSFITTRIFDAIAIIGIFSLFYFIYIDKFFLGVLSLIISPFLFLPISYGIKLIKHQKVEEYKDKLNLKNLANIYILSILTLIFKFSAFYVILPSSLNLSIPKSFLAFSTADITTVLPIHGIAGIGTYESGFGGILILLGADKDTAFLSATLVHIFIIFSSSLLSIITYIKIRKS